MNIIILLTHNYYSFEKPFVLSLFNIFNNFYAWQRESGRNDNLSYICQDGFSIDKMRNDVVKEAMDDKYDMDMFLFLDTDMTFPDNLIQLMIEDFKDNPGVEAITGLYTWKKPPFVPHIYPEFDEKSGKFGMARNFDLNSIFPVAGAGMGCVMIKKEVFKQIQEPYFAFDHGMGEDFYFFKKAHPMMLCDTRIICKHWNLMGVDIYSYINHNNLDTQDVKRVEMSESQVKKVLHEHKQLNNM